MLTKRATRNLVAFVFYRVITFKVIIYLSKEHIMTNFEKLASKDIKAPMTAILMWQNARVQNKVKYEVMGSESFRVVSKESPIKELK